MASGVVGVATTANPALWIVGGLGLVGSVAGYSSAIDDANEEHNDYLIHMELYHRFQDPQIGPEIFNFHKKSGKMSRLQNLKIKKKYRRQLLANYYDNICVCS